MTENQTTETFTEGDRVLVTAVSFGATDRYREFAVGQHATYVRPDGGTLHRVRFDEAFESEGGALLTELAVTRVQRAIEGDWRGDTIRVGEYYTSPVPQFERCLTIDARSQWRCSRPKSHTGQHVGARSHDGEVVATWAGTNAPTGDPQPGDRVRVTAVASTADDDFRARVVGASARLVGTGGLSGAPYVVHLDEQYRYAGATEWHVAGVEPITEPTGQPEQVTASEPADEDAEAVAKDEYERLARGAILVAAEHDWCTEFEDVMSNGMFPEVRCNRARAYTLEINVEFPLDTQQLDDAIRRTHRVGQVSMDVTYDKNIETTMRLGWTGTGDPNELNTSQLNELLHEAGVDGQDFYATTLENSEDEGEPEGLDPTHGFEADLGGSTWVARRDAFVSLLQTQARSRAWGEHLTEVYAHAGLPAPRAKKIEVEVIANKKVFRYDGRYGQAFTAEGDNAEALTLHKTLRFQIDNPAADTDCHCKDHTVYGRSGDASELSPVLRNAVFNGARATLRDLYGDAAAGWAAGNEDVLLSCMYCE